MLEPHKDKPHNNDPTAAEIYRLFRNTTMASISAMRLLLVECADLRADLITVHDLNGDGEGNAAFSRRQQDRILELENAAIEMVSLLASLPSQPDDRAEPCTDSDSLWS